MYHVTNVKEEDPQPNWETVKACSIANDKIYDGDLLGLPLASFTTTSYINDKGKIGLPTISPYPRSIPDLKKYVKPGTKHHRVKTPFYMDDYHIYYMGEHKGQSSNACTQIQLLCIRKQGRDSFEDEVFGIMLLQHYEKVLLPNTYFPNGEANIYTTENKVFVNVHFTHDIDIRGAAWDLVPKRDLGTGKLDPELNDRHFELSELRSLWCIKHHFNILNDKILHLREKQMASKILSYLGKDSKYKQLTSLYEPKTDDEDLPEKLDDKLKVTDRYSETDSNTD